MVHRFCGCSITIIILNIYCHKPLSESKVAAIGWLVTCVVVVLYLGQVELVSSSVCISICFCPVEATLSQCSQMFWELVACSSLYGDTSLKHHHSHVTGSQVFQRDKAERGSKTSKTRSSVTLTGYCNSSAYLTTWPGSRLKEQGRGG